MARILAIVGVLILLTVVGARGQVPPQRSYLLGPDDVIEIVIWSHGDLVPNVEEAYLLGPGDTVEINVWPQSELSRTAAVGPDGRVSFPPFGEVVASGLTTRRLSARVHELLIGATKDTKVTVIVNETKLLRSNVVEAFGRSRTITVRPDGRISLPVLGDLQVSGQTPEQVAGRIARGLEPYVRRPRVSVIVTEFKGKRVSILGQVTTPGHYRLREDARLAEALAVAGGPTFAARLQNVVVMGTEGSRRRLVTVNVERVLRGEDSDSNLLLEPHDVVFVPGSLREALDDLHRQSPNLQIQIQVQGR